MPWRPLFVLMCHHIDVFIPNGPLCVNYIGLDYSTIWAIHSLITGVALKRKDTNLYKIMKREPLYVFKSLSCSKKISFFFGYLTILL